MASSATTTVDEARVRKAITALVKHANAEGKSSLLVGSAPYVHLVIGMRRIPDKGKNKPYRIHIPHSLFPSEDADFCLFAKDPTTGVEEGLVKAPVQGFNKVIGYSTLRNNYTQFKQRRKLCAGYDAFFCDDRILPIMPRLLGRVFFEKKKHPVPVRLAKRGPEAVAKALTEARDATYLYLGWGPCTSVKVGRIDFSVDAIVENIMAAIPRIVERIPKKWKAIQVMHVKTTDSVSLPIFNSLPELDGADDSNLPSIPKQLAGAGAAGAGADSDSDVFASSAEESDSDGESAKKRQVQSAVKARKARKAATPAAKSKAKKAAAGAKTTGGRNKKGTKRFFDDAAPSARKSKKARTKKKQ